MNIVETDIEGLQIIEPRVFGDERGFFMETWNEGAFKEAGLDFTFVQDNHSKSAKGVLRGLHYQIGDRISSSDGALQRMGIDMLFVNQTEEQTLNGDDSGRSDFLTKCGQSKAAMSRGERHSKLLKRALDKISDIGVHLIQ